MKNYIIGSGVIGLLARKVFPNWGIISQKPSRYYSFNPALADNYIQYDKGLEDKMKVVGIDGEVVEYSSPFSVAGQLMFQENNFTTAPYLNKVYGDSDRGFIKTHMWIYSLPVSTLYGKLVKEYDSKVDEMLVTRIDTNNRIIHIKDGEPIEYDNIISTVPLDVLYKWAGDNTTKLESRPVCYYRIHSESVDLEGSDQSYVVDEAIDFFKVTKIKDKQYIFWSFDQVDNPHNYFGQYLGYTLNIIDSFRIEDVIPIGPLPDLRNLEEMGIYCIGSNARWDDFVGVSECIDRIFRVKACLS